MATRAEQAEAGQWLANVSRDGSNGERSVLVVGESETFEYSVNLARQHSTWKITATQFDPLGSSSVPQLPNLTVLGGVDARALQAHFSANTFDDVVFNAPRANKGWVRETGDLIDSVLMSARSVVRSGGVARFSSGRGMPGVARLAGHAQGNESFPFPLDYSPPIVEDYLNDPNFGVRYTPRNNTGGALPVPLSAMKWYNFLVK